jgi:hypothetical protein
VTAVVTLHFNELNATPSDFLPPDLFFLQVPNRQQAFHDFLASFGYDQQLYLGIDAYSSSQEASAAAAAEQLAPETAPQQPHEAAAAVKQHEQRAPQTTPQQPDETTAAPEEHCDLVNEPTPEQPAEAAAAAAEIPQLSSETAAPEQPADVAAAVAEAGDAPHASLTESAAAPTASAVPAAPVAAVPAAATMAALPKQVAVYGPPAMRPNEVVHYLQSGMGSRVNVINGSSLQDLAQHSSNGSSTGSDYVVMWKKPDLFIPGAGYNSSSNNSGLFFSSESYGVSAGASSKLGNNTSNTNRRDNTVHSCKHSSTKSYNSLIQALTQLPSLDDDVHSKSTNNDQFNAAGSGSSSSSTSVPIGATFASSFAAANSSSGSASFMRASTGGSTTTVPTAAQAGGFATANFSSGSSSFMRTSTGGSGITGWSSSISASFLQTSTISSSGTGWSTTATEHGAKQTAPDGRTYEISFAHCAERCRPANNTSSQDSFVLPYSQSYSTSSLQGSTLGLNGGNSDGISNWEAPASSNSTLCSSINSTYNSNDDSTSSSSLMLAGGSASSGAGSSIGIACCSITRFAQPVSTNRIGTNPSVITLVGSNLFASEASSTADCNLSLGSMSCGEAGAMFGRGSIPTNSMQGSRSSYKLSHTQAAFAVLSAATSIVCVRVSLCMEFALLRNTSSQDKLMLGHSCSGSTCSSGCMGCSNNLSQANSGFSSVLGCGSSFGSSSSCSSSVLLVCSGSAHSSRRCTATSAGGAGASRRLVYVSSSSSSQSSSMDRSWNITRSCLKEIKQQQQQLQLQYNPLEVDVFTTFIPSSSRFVWTDSCAPKPACWGSCNCPVWPRQQATQQQLQILEWPQPYTNEQYQAMLMLLAQQSHRCDCEAH